MSESNLILRLTASLSRTGYKVRREVPNMGQSVDVVATKNRWITAIEAKVRDWRNALRQCVAHELVADYVCIAIGTDGVSEAFIQEAQTRGYGVIHCPAERSRCEWILRPRKNNQVWRPQRNRFTAALKAIDHEH